MRKGKRKGPLLGALALSWKYLILTVIVGGGLYWVAHLNNFTVALGIVKTFIGPKAALMSILMASVIFYHRFVWDDIERVKPSEYHLVVGHFAGTLCFLFGAVVLLVISVAADAYTIFLGTANWLIRISSVCSAVALIYLLVFIVWLAVRTLGQMQTLKEAGELAKESKKKKQE
ncbi:MAG: hypothetical protein KAV98_00045 [Dehalococcoidia bacterium]|nr:hypothetical protein [Dehalococcoidia bacterium]